MMTGHLPTPGQAATLDALMTAAFVLIPRTMSMLAQYLEEKSQGTRWRHVPASEVVYTGPMPKD